MDKEILYRTVEEKASVITTVSDRIWEYAELSMMEVKSAAEYVAVLKAEGFAVQENLCGIATAFSGSYGSGRPVIGFLGEFDALSGLSQMHSVVHPQAITEGGCGHGCGHNLLGAGALGAAIAVKEAIEAGVLQGTVIFFGCPGEEGCAGKTFMAREGIFKDLDAAITWHPGDTNEIMYGSNAACMQSEFSFTGIAAHAAGDPFNGRSALDAAELMNVGVQFLREHMPEKSSIHYSFSDAGGISPNVVQPTAKLIYMVRSDTVQHAKALLARVEDIARGAALMTGTSVTWRQIDGTASTVSNNVIENVLHANLCEAPLPQYTEDEIIYAKQLRATYDTSKLPGTRTYDDVKVKKFILEATENGTKPINDFVVIHTPCNPFSPSSTDVGDVSWLTPTAQFSAATWPSGSPGHSWQNVSCGKTSIAHKGLLYAAKVLAGAAADLMENAALLKEAREEFEIAAAEGYDCPISADLVPLPQ